MNKQGGMVLVVGMLFLLAMALLGIAAFSGNILQERMAGDNRDIDTAFQAAEAALRDGELDVVRDITPDSAFNASCTAGLCLLPSGTSTPRWESIDWSDTGVTRAYGSYTGMPALPKVQSQPRYIIEQLPPVQCQGSIALGIRPPHPFKYPYRITARAVGARPQTQVILQSTYVVSPC